MIKGWRNDPAWCEFYKRRDEERLQRQIERVKMEHEMARNQARLDASLRNLCRPVPTSNGLGW